MNIDGSINNKDFTKFPVTSNRFAQSKFKKVFNENKQQHYCEEIITSDFKKGTIFPSNFKENNFYNNNQINKKNYTLKKPNITEYDEKFLMLNELSSSLNSNVLVAKEVSLLTSFDSSNTSKKRFEYEKYQKLILPNKEIVKDSSNEIIGNIFFFDFNNKKFFFRIN